MDENNNIEDAGGGVSDGGAKYTDRLLPASILIAAVLVSGSLIFATIYKGSAPSAPAGDAPAAQAPDAGINATGLMKAGPRDQALGSANAPITIVEYGDYQCPFCASFFVNTEPQLKKNYIDTGKVRLVFRNFMVNDRSANDHESHNAALAAECAKDQNKFWDFHDALYSAEVKDEQANPAGAENNGNLTRALFVSIAGKLGMNKAQFASCYDSGKYVSAVQSESNAAAAAGVSATPTFLVGGVPVIGAQPYASFQAVIDPLLHA